MKPPIIDRLAPALVGAACLLVVTHAVAKAEEGSPTFRLAQVFAEDDKEDGKKGDKRGRKDEKRDDKQDYKDDRRGDKQEFKEEKRGDKQEFKADRREGKQEFKTDQRQDRRDYRDGKRDDRQEFKADQGQDRQQYKDERRDDKRDFKADRREDKQEFKADQRQDKRDYRDGKRDDRQEFKADQGQDKQQYKDERRDDKRDFKADRRDDKRDFRDTKREDKEERRDARAEQKFQDLVKGRRERVEGGKTYIEEADKRVIVKDKGKVVIIHDESDRLDRGARDVKVEKRRNGVTAKIITRPSGVFIISETDDKGHLLRRVRRDKGGREVVIIDNRRYYGWWGFGPPRPRPFFGIAINLGPPVIRIPREKYIVEYDGASEEDVYEALSAPPVERLDRVYSLEEIRRSHVLRERMRRVDLDTINFAFASWEVERSQWSKLEELAHALRQVIDRNPDEVFLIEGHTDAVGSDIDNLSLSDRRAEAVANILTDEFDVPPENLVTQGYGEEFLKIDTPYPERANRRVAVRRITPLLSQGRELSSRTDDRGGYDRDDREDRDAYRDGYRR